MKANGNSNILNSSLLGKNLFSITGLIIAAVLLLVINLFSNLVFNSARIDLTDGNIYSLSDGTKSIIEKIEEPITLRYYFSKKLLSDIPSISNYGKRVKELLVEYEKTSGGNIKLILIDPEPFSELEDQAVQYGIQALPLGDGRTKAYFGLIGTNATDKEELIAFFQSEKEDSLEYDITKLVNLLSDNKKKVVGLMTSLPMAGGAPPSQMMMMQGAQGNDEWYILTQLKQFFEVKTLDTTIDKIPDNIDVLLLAHAKSLSDKTQFAIDQFVLNGGHALIFVDPFSEADAPPQGAQQNPQAAMSAVRDSNLDKLFKSWGVELTPGKIVGDRINAARVGVNTGQRVQPVEYIAWLVLPPESFNQNDFVTNSLKSVAMGSVGHFTILEAKTEEIKTKEDNKYTKTITPLIQSSASSMEIDQMQFRFGVNPISLLQNFVSSNKKFNIAVRVTGIAKTAFPDGAPEGVTTAKDIIKESKEAINVILVADTDMLENKFWVNIQNFLGQKLAVPRANNDAFLINAIDNLSGSNDLISLRTRGRSNRPFTTVVELKREAEQEFQAKEKSLQAKLNETEQKLNALQQQKQGQNAAILSLEQRTEIENFRNLQVSTRKELRAVQHELGKSIEQLGSKLQFINIALIPILIAIFAIVMGVRRSRRSPVKV